MTRPAGREWTVEEAALFAARRDYELLRLLSTDRRALATARRLGCVPAAAVKVAGKPPQAATAEPAGGDDVDGPVGDRVQKRRRKPRKPSAARQLVLDERFEQKRMKSKLLKILPQVRQWAERVAAQPAKAAECSPQDSPAIVEIAGTATGGSTAREAASPGAMEPPMNMETEEPNAAKKRERESSDEESSDDDSSEEEDLLERRKAALYKRLGFVEGAEEKAWRAERNKGRGEQARPYTPSVGASQNRYACLMQLGAGC